MQKAMKTKGNTINELFGLLETRLDNVVFRLNFAETRMQARQLVSHRHVLVNGKKVNIASYSVKVGDTISLSSKAMEIPNVSELLKKENENLPEWLNKKGAAGQIKSIPNRSHVPEVFSDQDVVEFYSR
jgi:small subunit ribosomal protein S4